jgi:hypothetical protein
MASERDKGQDSSASHAAGLRSGKDETKLDLRSSDDLRSKRLDRNHAKRLVQEILHEGTVSYTKHCEQELTNDAMDVQDTANVLRCGKIEREPEPAEKFGSWRYQVETQRMAVVVEIHSKTSLRVITAWRKKKKT